MKTSDALQMILKTAPGVSLPNGIENDVSTNIPLAIAMSTRALVEALENLRETINVVVDRLDRIDNRLDVIGSSS